MAILSTSNLLSEQRYNVDDARRIESAVRNDFDTTVTAILTNVSQGYIVRGFSIITSGAIGSAANGLQMAVDPGSVMHIAASVSGTIFQTPLGTPNQVLNASINTNVSGSFSPNSTNYVGIDYSRFADPTTNITKNIWNASANDEIQTIAPAAQTLTFKIFITTSVWAINVLPVAIVTTDSDGNVTSITDARWLYNSLETGGLNPNPNFVYPWSQGRNQSPITTTSDSVNPFIGGDKQLFSDKDWKNAVMTTFLEVKGTPYWFSGGGSSPLPSIASLLQDLGNTVITGSGEISNGILPNSEPILVTTGTIAASSNQLTSLASTAGIANGDFIVGTGIPQGTVITVISGSTVTMSNDATLNGTGINVKFYSPSVITAPGQINWDEPISIRVVGSNLSYIISANPSSTDISLSDDQAAYITLVRDVPISPNLIFSTGSPTINSVGAVSWTSGLLAGDYVKLASDDVSGYYKIQTINSSSQVTLTANVSSGDNTGSLGAKAKYAFGSYSTSPSPSTNRNIFISSRETVPQGGNVFWLFLREDNGGSPRVYVRFLSRELDNGESVEVSGTTSQELLEYIGAPSAASSSPQYVSALDPGSIAQVTSITIGSAATITTSQYFFIYSSGNFRKYYVWFKKDGAGSDPTPPGTNDSIEVDISTGMTATQVAGALAVAFNSSIPKDFSAVGGSGTVSVTNTSAGTSNSASNFNVGAPFAVSVSQSGTGIGNIAIKDGDSLTLAIKELDEAVAGIVAALDGPDYDETVDIVASGATPTTSLNGPVISGTVITLPNNSRLGNVPQKYTVGKGVLELYLNGQYLRLGTDWSEIGASASTSSTVTILQDLEIFDSLEFRITAVAGAGGGAGGSVGPPGPAGPTGPTGHDAAGGPVAISTKVSSYTIMLGDNALLANCAGGNITFTLPTAAAGSGHVFYFKKIDNSTNLMVIQANGVELIDGSNTQSTTVQYEEFTLISDGTAWYIF